MELSVNTQLWQFIYAILFGGFLGVFYDVFRILRTIIYKGKALIIIEDIIYLFVSSIFTFCFAFYINNGQLRFFIIIGIIFGITIYYFTIGVLVIRSAKIIIFILRKVFAFVFGVIIYPFVKIYIVLTPFFEKIKKNLIKMLLFLKNSFSFCKKHIIIYKENKIKKTIRKGGKELDVKNTKRENIKAYNVCNNFNTSSASSYRFH